MQVTNTVVDAVKRDGKALKIGNDWYSAFKASQIGTVKAGDAVSFEYIEKGEWKNIKGSVSINSPSTTAVTYSNARPTVVPNTNRNPYAAAEFPVSGTDPVRRLIRQAALEEAIKISSFDSVSIEDRVTETLRAAKLFEAYIAGDNEAKEVEDILKEMNKNDSA